MLKISAIAWYEINRDFIVTELCEQKAVLENNCQGNCQLSKKLQLTDESKEDSEIPFSNVKLEVMDFVLCGETQEKTDSLVLNTTYNIAETPAIRRPFLDELFRPPAC